METTNRLLVGPAGIVERYGVVICSVGDLVYHVMGMCVEAFKTKEILLHIIPLLDFFDHVALSVLWVGFILFHGACICLNLFYQVTLGVFTLYVNDADLWYHRICTIHNIVCIIFFASCNIIRFLLDRKSELSDLRPMIGLAMANGILSYFRGILKDLIVSPQIPKILTLCEVLDLANRDEEYGTPRQSS